MLSSPLHLPVSLQVRRKKDDQFCRYSPNSKYLLSSCQDILAVFGSSSAISSSVQNVWNIPPSSYCSPETTTTSIDSRASELLSIILTFMLYLYWCHFPHIAKRLPNLVNARWLWRISLGIWANQKPRTISWAISEIMVFPIIIIWRKLWRNYGIDWDIQKDGGFPSCQKSAS